MRHTHPLIRPLALALSVILSCGWLVSCQPMDKSQDSSSDSSLPEEDTSFVELMFQAIDSDILDTGTPIDKELLSAFTQDSYTLNAASFLDDYPRYILALGVRPLGSSELASPMFQADGMGGIPHVQQFMKDGRSYLLYTVNSARQGYSAGEAGVVTLDGPDLTWVWPVEGDIRDKTSQAYADYQTFWEHRKALIAPGGVDVFVENEDFGPFEDSPPQWVPEFGESFYRTPEDELPIGVMYQTRAWLEDFSRHFNNPWDARNTSALWSIQSVTPIPYDGLREGEQAYRLIAQADDNNEMHFTASLVLNADHQVTQVIRWDQGSAKDVEPRTPGT